MTTNWKYTDNTNTVVVRILDSGVIESRLVSALPPEVVPLPANPVVVPPVTIVTPLQARRALAAAGLLASVNSTVASAPLDAQLAWEFATSVHRNDPIVASLAASLGLSSAQVDALFTQAATY